MNKVDKAMYALLSVFYIILLGDFTMNFTNASSTITLMVAMVMGILFAYAKGTNIQLQIFLPSLLFIFWLVSGY